MGGGSGGGSSGAGWTLMLLPAVDGEILAEYWTDTNATPVEVTAGHQDKRKQNLSLHHVRWGAGQRLGYPCAV